MQIQNVTQIGHWNTGLGWASLKETADDFEELWNANYTDQKAKDLAIWKFMKAHKLDKGKRDKIPNFIASPYATHNHDYKELLTIATLTHSAGPAGTTPLDFFQSYDIASGEAFHLFGIDPFNDVIPRKLKR